LSFNGEGSKIKKMETVEEKRGGEYEEI